MRNLLWFHAFRPATADVVLGVLENGIPVPGKTVVSKTAQNEQVLGLPRRVYAYLGRGTDDFGPNGFALPMNAARGDVSPFDTGGLVEYIQPVSSWDEAQKRSFLSGFSWKHDHLAALLGDYPSAPKLGAYLDGTAPDQLGPHEIWKGDAAEIWHPDSGNEWRAWTWEIRCASLQCGQHIDSWTCPPHVFRGIREIGEKRPKQAKWFEFLFDKYVPGGLSQLIKVSRLRQEAA